MSSLTSKNPAYWVIVPAAGIGSRMEADRPKQYLPLLDQTILEHALSKLLAISLWKNVHVAIAEHDSYWGQLRCRNDHRIIRVPGGSERATSVLNGLNAISPFAHKDDWVLVHDAARPCIRIEDIHKLIKEVMQHPVGGILGIPVSDTLKMTNGNRIKNTLDRRTLWQAQTPQMFRVGLLRDCLQRAFKEGRTITDEASAVEAYGFHPLIVQGRSDNIKVTRPEDLIIAAAVIQHQIKHSS